MRNSAKTAVFVAMSVSISKMAARVLGAKNWGSVAVAVTGGFSFYSYVPRVVNPLKATDPDVHLEGQNAYSQYILASLSYAI